EDAPAEHVVGHDPGAGRRRVVPGEYRAEELPRRRERKPRGRDKHDGAGDALLERIRDGEAVETGRGHKRAAAHRRIDASTVGRIHASAVPMSDLLRTWLGQPAIGRAARAAADWVDLQLAHVVESLARVAPRTRGRLLDVGCGDKPYEHLFRPYVSEYVGVEH